MSKHYTRAEILDSIPHKGFLGIQKGLALCSLLNFGNDLVTTA